MSSRDSAEATRFLDTLGGFGPVLALKVYRLNLAGTPVVPVLPCLDHEAMLHEGIAPHVAAYVQERASGDLHELVVFPIERKIEVDTVSTWGEYSNDSHARLLTLLADKAPDYGVHVDRPSWWRGERRVAAACRAQIGLREVLLGDDIGAISRQIDRLKAVGTLMEKQSRVASWGVRTVTGPILAAAAVITYAVLGALSAVLGRPGVTALQYVVIGVLGAWFLYYGLKAVQLTEMSNKVWKRAVEYNLILEERKRLQAES